MKTTLFFFSSLLCATLCFASQNSLDSLMTPAEKKTTGYTSLSPKEKASLNNWIDNHFTLTTKNPEEATLSLSVNVHNGKELILNDGSKWLVAPEDQTISSLWLTPFPLKLLPSNSSEYPKILLNLSSEDQVKIKPIESENTPP